MTVLLLIAGLADVAENILLLHILDGGRGMYPAAMFCMATVKFGSLLLFLIWLVVSGIWKLVKKP